MKNQKSLYEQQEAQILERAEQFIDMLTNRGVIGDIQVEDEKRRFTEQERKKIAYHNTQMLLRNYRHIIWQAENEAVHVARELDLPLQNLDAILSRVDAELGMGNRRLEARLESVRRSRILIDRVNEALSLLKKKPENGERLYEIIYLTYIIPEKLNQNDILYRLDISRRHFYRLREQALSFLSIRLWGAPTAELDIWLDLLTLFGKDA